ncbi:hypothetical protein AC1031_008840 [Aphanomyces cochlioides]|nr:hypothetical protein AC1031_008840 [Aphanomyces cochlioides]
MDFPLPTVQTKASKEFVGTVNSAVCRSSSFIFSALIIFWKAVITFGGMYMSFLIRNAGSDFQESVWIFASSCIVMVGALILLPMAYLTELSPTIEYTFQSVVIVLGTLSVIGCMLVPKFFRLGDQIASSKSKQTGRSSNKSSKLQSTTKVHLRFPPSDSQARTTSSSVQMKKPAPSGVH